MNEAEAIEALMGAAGSPQAQEAPAPAAAAPAEQAPTTQPTPTIEPAATPSTTPAPAPAPAPQAVTPEDSFTSTIDPTALDPALLPVYKQMQADYTRKTQELAAIRKFADEAGGVDAARQAYEFTQRLNTDADFAMSVHRQLSEALQSAGLTPAQAAAEASRQMDETDDTDDTDYAPVPPQVTQELQELRAWREQIEQERIQTYLANEMQRQEMAIRQANPSYNDADMQRVYQLSHATGGDLVQAQQSYAEMQQQFLASYMQQKDSIPAAATPPAMTPMGQQPRRFDNLDQAYDAAREHLSHLGY